MNTSDGRFYYKVTVSSWKGCNPGSLQQVVQNDAFYGNNRRNISREIDIVV